MKYGELRQHIGHEIACVCYGKPGYDPQNIAVECVYCSVVLMDYDRPEKRGYCKPCEDTQYIDDDGECAVCGTVIKE